MKFSYALVAFLWSSLFAAPSQAVTLENISISDKTSVGDRSLILNGTGIRKATIFKVKVYIAALYLQNKSSDAKAILNSKELKKIDLHFVHDVSADKMTNAWSESFKNNCQTQCAEMLPLLAKLNSWMVDLQKGDQLSFVFSSDSLAVSVKGDAPKTIAGSEFSKVILASWLGPKPPNADLKDGLLGITQE